MSGRVSRHGEVSPRQRVGADDHGRDASADGYFFTGEIVAMLGLGDIDYHQVRRLLLLVREQAGSALPGPREWARYSLRDIAGLEVLLALCGGREALAAGRRLQIAPVARACRALRELGAANPLLDVPMRREGRRVLATVSGQLLDPVTGQTALEAGHQRVEDFLEQRQISDAQLRKRLLTELAARAAGQQRTVRGDLDL